MGKSVGISVLEKFIADGINDIQVVDAVIVSDCKEGSLCAPEGFFCQIENCKLCGVKS